MIRFMSSYLINKSINLLTRYKFLDRVSSNRAQIAKLFGYGNRIDRRW